MTHTSSGDIQTLKGRSGSVSVGTPDAHKVLSEPFDCLWWVWGLSLNAISPLLLSCWGFSFAFGCGVSFLGEIQHSLVDGCSAASGNFGVLAGEDECTSFYSSFPHGQSLPSGSFHKPLILLHQRADRMKTTITENESK